MTSNALAVLVEREVELYELASESRKERVCVLFLRKSGNTYSIVNSKTYNRLCDMHYIVPCSLYNRHGQPIYSQLSLTYEQTYLESRIDQ